MTNIDKNKIISLREQFFKDIVSNISREVEQLDLFFGQDKYYAKPNLNSIVSDPINGELTGEVNSEFFGIKFTFLYSVLQIGTQLKVGILLKDQFLFDAFSTEDQSSWINIWGI